MMLGICASVGRAGLSGLGVDYVEENVQDFLLPERDAKAYAAALAGLGPLPILGAANCFLPAAMKCVGPDVDRPAILAYAQRAFERAGRLGMGIIVFGSGGSRTVPAGFSRDAAFSQFVGLLRDLGPLAQAGGVVLAVEPLNRGECNLINSLAEGAEAVLACGHPCVGLTADLYHMAVDSEGPEAIERHGVLLRHAHVAEREGRACPGVHGDDFRPCFRALKGAGYRGALSIECNWGSLGNEAPRGLQTLRKQLSDAGF